MPKTAPTQPTGRGCPACGSHDTAGLRQGRQLGAQWCNACYHKWLPCTPYCRGYDLVIKDVDTPTIKGCKKCGTPDHIARWWPEAHAAMGRYLLKHIDKSKGVDDQSLKHISSGR